MKKYYRFLAIQICKQRNNNFLETDKRIIPKRENTIFDKLLCAY